MKKIEQHLILLARYNVELVIIGGVAAVLHGSAHITKDLDICYARNEANLKRLAEALQSVHARLRGVPADWPFRMDWQTLRHGLNFTFETDLGPLDVLGEVAGVGDYQQARENAIIYDLFGHQFAILSLEKLIAAKRAAGRAKDLLVLPELEALLEYQNPDDSSQES
jgi:hypothetical protein